MQNEAVQRQQGSLQDLQPLAWTRTGGALRGQRQKTQNVPAQFAFTQPKFARTQ